MTTVAKRYGKWLKCHGCKKKIPEFFAHSWTSIFVFSRFLGFFPRVKEKHFCSDCKWL